MMVLVPWIDQSEADVRICVYLLGFEAAGARRGAEGAHALRGLCSGNQEEDPQDERSVLHYHHFVWLPSIIRLLV
jgi:hypothetical protein